MIKASKYNATIEQYCDDIISGNIVSCVTAKQAVERHLKDLERQETSDFPFYFDHDEAEKACKFFTILRHTKGRWAGNPFELSPSQCFITGSIYGWKRTPEDDGKALRRFRRALISQGRKGGKSAWVSGLNIKHAVADGENVPEVYIGATKRDQAKIIFDECGRMVAKSKAIGQIATVLKDRINFQGGGKIEPVGSDRPYDGLGPSFVALDEIHAWKELHRPFYQTITTGSGARDQPLIVIITTAGDDRSLIYLEVTDYVRSLLSGMLTNESYFGIIYELDKDDDPFDESVWPKANPNLGISTSVEYLREQAEIAKGGATQLNTFERYHCNRLVTSLEKEFNDADWLAAGTGLSDWNGCDIGAGFDLGGQDDLASLAHCAKFVDGIDEDGVATYRYEVRQQSYIAEGGTRDVSQEPFATALDAGTLKRAKYVTTELKADLIDSSEENYVGMLAYDPYGARHLAEELEQIGVDLVKMPQNYSHYNDVLNDFNALLKAGKITHSGDDDILTWAVGNAVSITNRNGEKMLDKRSSRDKIDPIIAVLMAFRAARSIEISSGKAFIT